MFYGFQKIIIPRRAPERIIINYKLPLHEHFNSFMTEFSIIQKPVHWFALQIKSINWCLYDRNLCRERVKPNAWCLIVARTLATVTPYKSAEKRKHNSSFSSPRVSTLYCINVLQLTTLKIKMLLKIFHKWPLRLTINSK